jgi:hypothetical protein
MAAAVSLQTVAPDHLITEGRRARRALLLGRRFGPDDLIDQTQ